MRDNRRERMRMATIGSFKVLSQYKHLSIYFPRPNELTQGKCSDLIVNSDTQAVRSDSLADGLFARLRQRALKYERRSWHFQRVEKRLHIRTGSRDPRCQPRREPETGGPGYCGSGTHAPGTAARLPAGTVSRRTGERCADGGAPLL